MTVLVLLSFALVLVAAVLLVFGWLIADPGLPWIYASIASSLAAGILLLVSTRASRGAPAAGTVAVEPAPAPVTETVSVLSPAAAVSPPAPGRDDEFFPIADYESLSSAQVLPLLAELYAEEVEVVDAQERAGQGRPPILDRLAELRQQLQSAPPDSTSASLAAAESGKTVVVTDGAPVAHELPAPPVKRATTRTPAPRKAVAVAKAAPARTAKAAAGSVAASKVSSKTVPAKKATTAPATKARAIASAPVAKVPTAKVPTAKVPTAKVPTSKATGAKAAASKATGAKAAATKATAAKATLTTATPTKKAVPAKKAAPTTVKKAAPATKAAAKTVKKAAR